MIFLEILLIIMCASWGHSSKIPLALSMADTVIPNSSQEISNRNFIFDNSVNDTSEFNPKEISYETIPPPKIEHVTAFKLTGLGFEDHLLGSIVHVGKTDPNQFFVWLLGGHVVPGGAKVDPHTKSRGLFVGQKTPEGQSILLSTNDLHLVTEGTPLPIDTFRTDGKFQEFSFTSLVTSASLFSFFTLPEPLLKWFYGGRTAWYQLVGVVEGWAVPPEVVRKPNGVSFERIFSRISDKFGQLQMVAVLHYEPSVFNPQEHVLSIVLLDDSSMTVVPYSYLNNLHIETNTTTPGSIIPSATQTGPGSLHVVLSIPHEVKELPLNTRAIVMVDLFPLYSDVLDLEETETTTHHLWYHLFGNELLTLLISAVLLVLYDQTFRHLPSSLSDRSWLMTLISSIITSLVGCYITYSILTRPPDTQFHDMVWDDHILSRASLYYFIAYLFLDLFIGSYQYKSQITVATGYLHHTIYTGLSMFLLMEKMTNVLAMFFVLEIPTVVLAVGHLHKKWRQDMGFGVIFFVTRILYHMWLLYVLWPSIIGTGKMCVFMMGVFTWGLHWHWFLSWLKGERRRRKERMLKKNI